MSKFIALCDASFCPNKKFAYAGYRILQLKNSSLIFSNIWRINPSGSSQAEDFSLKMLVNFLKSSEMLKHSTIFCDHLHLVRQSQKMGLNIIHIKGHKSPQKRNWIDWEFSKLDCELRKLLRENR